MANLIQCIIIAHDNKPAGSAGDSSWSEYCTMSLQREDTGEVISLTRKNFQYNQKEHGSICFVTYHPKGSKWINISSGEEGIYHNDMYKFKNCKNVNNKTIEDLKADNSFAKIMQHRRCTLFPVKKSK